MQVSVESKKSMQWFKVRKEMFVLFLVDINVLCSNNQEIILLCN